VSGKAAFLFGLASAILGAASCLALAAIPFPALAQSETETPAENNCLTCHENLYLLHDTGNWFCLREAPMSCVDCHGGDPTALTEELAHTNRAAHPVVNEDVSQCQKCHPEECYDRVALFDRAAGISEVLVANSFSAPPVEDLPAAPPAAEPAAPGYPLEQLIPVVVLVSLTAAVYLVYRRR
jgi:hypothetical protein